jgi:chemotaxis protein MotB
MASQMNMSLDAKGLQAAQGELKRIADDLERALAPLIDEKLVTIKRSALWLEVQINSDILFATGSAALDPQAQQTVGKLAAVLGDVPNSVRVEGYTDDRPIRTSQFPSNWELSSARAASVVHLFVRDGIPPERLAMIGYGEFRPIADNATEEGRNTNRRVLLIILASPTGPAPDLHAQQQAPPPSVISLPPLPAHAASPMPGAPPAPQVHEGVQ